VWLRRRGDRNSSADPVEGEQGAVAMEDAWLIVRRTGVEVRVRLNPKSSRDRIDGLYGDRLKIRLSAPPVDGQANAALIRFLAKALRLPPSCGRIVEGPRGRSKTVLFETDAPAEAAERLKSLATKSC
jgi:uncharacterized protein (TIGR00251 family)